MFSLTVFSLINEFILMLVDFDLAHTSVAAVIWYSGPSWALLLFRFYAHVKEIHWFLRVYHDWPAVFGLMWLYHQV
jgi:hypothetical protein